MNTDATLVSQRLYELLPAIYRLRDAEQGGPLRELIDVIAEQIAVVQEGLEQQHDNLFIETCAPWVVPYIGDLIGARQLHGKAPGVAGGRAAVADTLGLRRRKGTLAALEHTARTVTGYPAVAVEFFEHMSVTQWMNHVRPGCLHTVDLRDELALERLGGPFNRAAHTLEVRRIASGRGRYNIRNIGLFLFRLQSFALNGVDAGRIDDFRATFNPLGIDTPLYTNPLPEGDIGEFAGPEHVPMPLSRTAFKRDQAVFYGPNGALELLVNGARVPQDQIAVCNLGDALDGSGDWAHTHETRYGIDPVLGRIAAPTGQPAPVSLVVRYRTGLSDALGGGSYERGSSISGAATHTISAGDDVAAVLAGLGAGAVAEWQDSRTYTLAGGAPDLTIAAGQHVVLRAANGHRPTIALSDPLVIDAGDDATLTLDGFLIHGAALRITGTPASVTLRHCTLVPGISRTRQNEPTQPGTPSLIIDTDTATVTLERCICGTIRSSTGAELTITSSIIDATAADQPALHGAGTPGGALTIDTSTIIGRIHTSELHRASNSIVVARPSGTALPIRSERTQRGCMRFCVVPAGSRTPRRYRCVTILPRFTSLRFGVPGYCQLAGAADEKIRRGADDESEIGVFHDLYQPQRESDLRTRLDEFLRFGMEAGIFYAS